MLVSSLSFHIDAGLYFSRNNSLKSPAEALDNPQ
jgi:hypothetical protein